MTSGDIGKGTDYQKPGIKETGHETREGKKMVNGEQKSIPFVWTMRLAGKVGSEKSFWRCLMNGWDYILYFFILTQLKRMYFLSQKKERKFKFYVLCV